MVVDFVVVVVVSGVEMVVDSVVVERVRLLVGSPGASTTPIYSLGSSSTPIYSPRSSTPPRYSPGASTPQSYSTGTSRNAECSNCKQDARRNAQVKVHSSGKRETSTNSVGVRNKGLQLLKTKFCYPIIWALVHSRDSDDVRRGMGMLHVLRDIGRTRKWRIIYIVNGLRCQEMAKWME
nr:hypothetical protein [Tanacetum cinerariifolium]